MKGLLCKTRLEVRYAPKLVMRRQTWALSTPRPAGASKRDQRSADSVTATAVQKHKRHRITARRYGRIAVFTKVDGRYAVRQIPPPQAGLQWIRNASKGG